MATNTETVRGYDIVLYDGPCNLCNQSVQWVIVNDTNMQFRFASLQSEIGKELLAVELDRLGSMPDSIALVDRAGRVWFRSDAVIRIASKLGFPWSMMALGRCVPRFFRDAIYSWIARNRYRWFGKSDHCPVPTAETRSRFLDL